MQTPFEMRAGLPKKEPKMLEDWEQNHVYEQMIKNNEGKPRWVLHDGPPYANGNIHMGSALRCATRAERFLCHQITNLLIEERTQKADQGKLTPTETEILKLIAKGKSVKEIAAERTSSVHTIITHKKNIFRKIEVNNVYEATKYALHAGLVDLMEYYI